jgi:mannose/fructose/N-acetylgalactosamine-specific phosphotransferase system component IIC
MTFGEWALLAALGAVLFLDQWPALQSMASRPIVAGLLVGVVLGAPAEGALWGAVFEAMFLGVLPVGAARYPDVAAGAIAGTAVAILGRTDGLYPAGLAVAVAAATGQLGQTVAEWQRRWNARAVARASARVAAGDLSAPGREIVLALTRAAGLGAAQTLVAVGAGILVLWLVGGTPWVAPLPPRAVALVGLAAAGVEGLRRFGRERGPVVALGVVGGGAIVVWAS